MKLPLSLILSLPAVAAFIAPPLHAQTCAPAQQAIYEVLFESVWSEATHPQEFPSNNPHFSGLVGGTHNDAVSFWQTGQLATQGIQLMAESGIKQQLIAEVEEAIASGTAFSAVSGGGIFSSPGSATASLEASLDFSLATVVSMIAPSPDWFAGVSGTRLFVDGEWANALVVELYPYDAGTDSGATYVSPNQATVPAEPVFRIEGFPFLNGASVGPLGTFTFNLVDAVCLDSDGDTISDAADNCLHTANNAG